MTDLELYEEMARLARRGQSFALATVVEHGGSSPRKAGAKMLVRDDGSSLGSVGGGRIEQDTMAAARQALCDGQPRTLAFTLTEENGYACGGSMSIFVEPQGRRPLLVMFGAGHVGRAVSALAHGCGFRVVVVDDRPEFALPEVLPGADEIICTPIGDAFRQIRLERESFVIIATPGHRYDFEAVRGCLSSEAGFIGLLGSRRKREVLFRSLEEDGFDVFQRERVITPVGLHIGAHTPEEIAVSIVAQLISLRSAV